MPGSDNSLSNLPLEGPNSRTTGAVAQKGSVDGVGLWQRPTVVNPQQLEQSNVFFHDISVLGLGCLLESSVIDCHLIAAEKSMKRNRSQREKKGHDLQCNLTTISINQQESRVGC